MAKHPIYEYDLVNSDDGLERRGREIAARRALLDNDPRPDVTIGGADDNAGMAKSILDWLSRGTSLIDKHPPPETTSKSGGGAHPTGWYQHLHDVPTWAWIVGGVVVGGGAIAL